ncbi:hypothetical protein K340107D12_60510 [Blautia parvula]|uniref:Uncharacterized protein n=1 Tax=Blautia parvula TaxID=2877527 RepID=A0ABQ0C397_9FIRM
MKPESAGAGLLQGYTVKKHGIRKDGDKTGGLTKYEETGDYTGVDSPGSGRKGEDSRPGAGVCLL